MTTAQFLQSSAELNPTTIQRRNHLFVNQVQDDAFVYRASEPFESSRHCNKRRVQQRQALRSWKQEMRAAQ